MNATATALRLRLAASLGRLRAVSSRTGWPSTTPGSCAVMGSSLDSSKARRSFHVLKREKRLSDVERLTLASSYCSLETRQALLVRFLCLIPGALFPVVVTLITTFIQRRIHRFCGNSRDSKCCRWSDFASAATLGLNYTTRCSSETTAGSLSGSASLGLCQEAYFKEWQEGHCPCNRTPRGMLGPRLNICGVEQASWE